MNQSQRSRQMLKLWGIFFAQMLVLHLLLFAAWILIEPIEDNRLTAIGLVMLVYLAVFAVCGVLFYQRINAADSPVEYREARAQGIPATARVLEIQQTKWRIKRNRNFRLQSRPTRWEYEMRLRVQHPSTGNYEASLAEFLTGDQIPNVGDVIPVKVHPQRPEVIVMVI